MFLEYWKTLLNKNYIILTTCMPLALWSGMIGICCGRHVKGWARRPCPCAWPMAAPGPVTLAAVAAAHGLPSIGFRNQDRKGQISNGFEIILGNGVPAGELVAKPTGNQRLWSSMQIITLPPLQLRCKLIGLSSLNYYHDLLLEKLSYI